MLAMSQNGETPTMRNQFVQDRAMMGALGVGILLMPIITKMKLHMEFNELILKVSSSCNLNCKYCYVFNQGDTSYKKEPAVIDRSIIPKILSRIKEHCLNHKQEKFLVIFHGGEPLLVPKQFYVEFVEKASELKNDGITLIFGIQTNGTLLTQEWVDLLSRLEISIGISIDGPEYASEYRVYRDSKRCAYHEIMRGINLLKENNLPINVLSVINTRCLPNDMYSYIKEINVEYIDFLFPDVSFDTGADSSTAKWLCSLFDLWYYDKDKAKPMVRYFDSIVGLFMGVERGYEVIGRKANKTISIKPNGNLELVDNLKICGDGFTHTGLNIFNNTFDDISTNIFMQHYYFSHSDRFLCNKCKRCNIKEICGGGNLAHRYSRYNGFANPSAYCSVIYRLCSHIQNRLFADLPSVFNESTMDKIIVSI